MLDLVSSPRDLTRQFCELLQLLIFWIKVSNKNQEEIDTIWQNLNKTEKTQSLSIASAEVLGYNVVRFSLSISWCFKTTLILTQEQPRVLLPHLSQRTSGYISLKHGGLFLCLAEIQRLGFLCSFLFDTLSGKSTLGLYLQGSSYRERDAVLLRQCLSFYPPSF